MRLSAARFWITVALPISNVSVVALVAGAAAAPPSSCTSRSAECDVAAQVGIEVEERQEVAAGGGSVNLLQHRAVSRIVTSTVSAAAFRKAAALSQRSASDANLTRTTVYGAPRECKKHTGGSCFLSRCDESRGAICDNGMCMCKEFMCSDRTGRCFLSGGEVLGAFRKGVQGLQEQISELVGNVPELVDEISAGKGAVVNIFNSASDAFGDMVKAGTCKQTVGTCFSGCPETVHNTATCAYGVCSCKKNFCYAEFQGRKMCALDIGKLIGGR